MRRFRLIRYEDLLGVSGTGLIAEGVVSTNGKCALFWLTKYTSVVVYDSVDQVVAIHGNGSKTKLEWID